MKRSTDQSTIQHFNSRTVTRTTDQSTNEKTQGIEELKGQTVRENGHHPSGIVDTPCFCPGLHQVQHSMAARILKKNKKHARTQEGAEDTKKQKKKEE